MGKFTTMASAALAAISSFAALSISQSPVSEVTRSPTTTAVQISGITWAGGNLFYAVDDDDNKIYPLTVAIDTSTGKITSAVVGEGVTAANGSDLEGCAFDPRSGKLWVSSESSSTIREYDPATGGILRTAGAVPSSFLQAQKNGNFSLEALTISGDGLTMWTCNEEALKCDGEISSISHGTVVRLFKFTRPTLSGDWVAAGQWACEVTEHQSSQFSTQSRSGVSGMAALPDGTLLILERTLHGISTFYNRIYSIDFTGATDITAMPALTNAAYTAVGKTCLFNYDVGWANYEGMCLGPGLDDGSCSLVLVGDGGNCTKMLMSLKLSGLGIASLTAGPRGLGVQEPAGGTYRLVAGGTIDATISGLDYASAYTNNAAAITNVAWTLDGGGASLFGLGAKATVPLAGDMILTWRTSSAPFASPIDTADSFETYSVGASAADGKVGSWTGDGEVVRASYSPPDPPGFPMPRDPHTKALLVDGAVARDFPCTTNASDRLDLMMQVTRRRADSAEEEIPAGAKLAIRCAMDGTLELYCADSGGNPGWARLEGRTFNEGEWIRVTVSLDTFTSDGGEYALVRVNGDAFETDSGVHSPMSPVPGGAWYRTAGGTGDGRIAGLVFLGTTQIDDVIKTTGEFRQERSAATTAIDGVPLEWLVAHGAGDEPQAAVPGPRLGAAGYTFADAFDAGIDPKCDEPFSITAMRMLGDGRVELTLNGVRQDLDGDARNRLYLVVRMETPGGETNLVAGTTAIVGGATVWTSDEPVADGTGFFKALVSPQR